MLHHLRHFGIALCCLAGLSAPAFAQDAAQPPHPPVTAAPDKSRQSLAPDIKPEALWDGRKIMPFHAMDDPAMVAAPDANFLSDKDYVLGVTINGESRAYPTRYVWFHHIINDKIGTPAVPIAVSYCSVCNSGILFDPIVDGHPVKLDFYGLYNGVVTLCERDTESVLLQVEGRFVSGALQGKTLKIEPMLDTTWGRWKALHPATLVMSPDTPYRRYYSPDDKPEPRGYTHFPAPYFRPTVTRGDLRLPPFDKVLAVTLPETGKKPDDVRYYHRAYPMKTLEAAGGVLNDSLGKNQIAVFLEADTQTASAFSRRLDGKTLTFEARTQDGQPGIYDKQTGSRWNIEGLAEAGPLMGKSLPHLENHLSQWYGWSAYYPDTSIYGRTDPPQPGDPFAAPADKPADKPADNAAQTKPAGK